MGSWDSQVEYQEKEHTATPIVMEEGTDLGDYRMTTTDHMIRSANGV